MNKPIVHFDLSKHSLSTLEIGKCACIWPIDHPSDLVSNLTYVYTSKVVAISWNGTSFETENTQYVGVYE